MRRMMLIGLLIGLGYAIMPSTGGSPQLEGKNIEEFGDPWTLDDVVKALESVGIVLNLEASAFVVDDEGSVLIDPLHLRAEGADNSCISVVIYPSIEDRQVRLPDGGLPPTRNGSIVVGEGTAYPLNNVVISRVSQLVLPDCVGPSFVDLNAAVRAIAK